MKSNFTALPGIYAYWSTIGWSMLLGNVPAGPSSELASKPTQVSTLQDWEDEGGSVWHVASPQAKPAAKRARAAPTKKRSATAKRR